MTLAMFATITAAIALAIAVAAMSLAATITKRVGTRDPIAGPPFWRRVLRIRPVPPAAEAFAQFQGRDQRVAFIANPTKKDPAYPPMPNPGLTAVQIDAVAKYVLENYKTGGGTAGATPGAADTTTTTAPEVTH